MLKILASRISPPSPGVIGAVAAALAAAAALVLWVHFGTTVFFEMVATGIASCF